MKNLLHFTVLAICCCLTIVLGCAGEFDADSAVAANNSTNIQRLANLYFAFQMKHDFLGPEDEADFREFIQNYPKVKLERIGLDLAGLDDLFVSERDGQPFKIRYSVQGSMMGSSEPVIFETTGNGVKKMVGFLDMTQRDVEQQEYDRLWSGESTPATPARGDDKQ